jgi:hypothetical protein
MTLGNKGITLKCVALPGVSDSMRITASVVLSVFGLASVALTPALGADPIGDWLTEGNNVVHIDHCGSALCGTIVELGPAASLQGRPLLGSRILINLNPSKFHHREPQSSAHRGFLCAVPSLQNPSTTNLEPINAMAEEIAEILSECIERACGCPLSCAPQVRTEAC